MAPKTNRRSTPLTRVEILDAALSIVDEGGIEALTMRRVAAEVGVEAMSLYHHVPNKDALLDGLIERILTHMSVPSPAPTDWRDMMEAMLGELRRVLVEHPNVLPVLAYRPPATPTASKYVRGPLELLTQAGLSPTDVIDLYQSVLSFTFGHALLSSQFASRGHLAEEAAGELTDGMKTWDERAFHRSLRLILDGYAPPSAD